MAKIHVQPDCGNAPRKLFLKALNIAIAKGDLDHLTGVITEDINWIIVGKKNIAGKENYLTELKKQQRWKVKELAIDTIITHGADASVSGVVKTAGNLKFAFCDIYKFKGAGGITINSISTFIVRQYESEVNQSIRKQKINRTSFAK